MEIVPITYEDAKPWLLNKHYAKRMCPISYAFAAVEAGEIIGVVTYGCPLSSTLRQGICGDAWEKNVLELNRLVCNTKKNLASMIVGRSIKMLPKPSIIVSYADTGQGHIGYVYQATNFIYTGLSIAFKDAMVKGFEHKHQTSVGDEGRGHKSRIEFLKSKYGKENIYYVERGRKHRYIYLHGDKKQIKAMRSGLKYKPEPYPKGESKRYDVGTIQNQSLLDF